MKALSILLTVFLLAILSYSHAQSLYYQQIVPQQYLPAFAAPACANNYTPISQWQYKYTMSCNSADYVNVCKWNYAVDCSSDRISTCPWNYSIECKTFQQQTCTWKYGMECARDMSTCPWTYTIQCE